MAYIDREKTIKDIESKRLAFDRAKISVAEALRIQGKAIREAIENAPTADVVDVVRCKDCKYYERPSIDDDNYYCMSEHTQRLYSPNKTDFCSCGERRTDDGKL